MIQQKTGRPVLFEITEPTREALAAMIDLEPAAFGAHSLRRTKVSLVYKKTGDLRACQRLLGRRKLESTHRAT